MKTVAIDQYLDALIEDLRNSTEDDAFAQVPFAADRVETDPDRAVAIGVIVNELVINALKYAYPSGKGPIRVGLRARGEGSAVISVEDDGVGFSGAASNGSTGLGHASSRPWPINWARTSRMMHCIEARGSRSRLPRDPRQC